MRVATMFSHPCPESIVQAMVKSVRKHLKCEIVQLTDFETPKLDCVDSVRRLNGGVVSSFLARHLSEMEGDVLYLDYDTIVREDVSNVFEMDFDLAITKRTEKEIESKLIFKVCPNNVGVMFTRNTNFWRDVAKRYDERSDPPAWMKFQIIVTEAMNALDYKCIELDSNKYNYTPETRDEVLTCAIAHYKGFKKSWMVNDEDALIGERMVSELMKKGKNLSITEDHPYFKELQA